jgi:hypothetical protein
MEITKWSLVNWPYSPYDYNYPTNVFQAALAAMNPVHFDYAGETNVIHDKIEGAAVVLTERATQWVYQHGWAWTVSKYGWDVPTYSYLRAWAADEQSAASLLANWPTNELATGPYVAGGAPMWVRLYGSFGVSQWDTNFNLGGRTDLIDMLRLIGNGFTLNNVHEEGIMTYEVSDFRFGASNNALTWDYRLRVLVNGGLRFTGDWSISSGMRLHPEGIGQPTSDWSQARAYTWSPWYQSKLNTGVVHYGIGQHTVLNSVEGIIGTEANLTLWQRCGPFVVGGSEPRFAGGIVSLAQHYRAVNKHYGDVVVSLLPELRRTAVFALNNAVESRLKILQNNYLEVLKEIPELPELVPDFKGLVSLIKSAPWNKIRAGLKLGKWISSTFLQYSFGIAPTAGVLQELSSLGPKLGDLLANNSVIRHQRVRGSFTFVFNDEELKVLGIYDRMFGRTLSFTTRATSDLMYPESPVFLAIANMYGVGIQPSATQLWELLPGSFAADWWLNMSQRLSSVELSAITMMLKIRNVIVSYAVSVSDPDLDWNLATLLQTKSSTRFSGYHRELLSSVPTLTEGPVDLLRASGKPPQAILGALLYQFSSLGS